jgi:hypothetical protein
MRPDTAQHGVETAVGESERLAIGDDDRCVRRACEALSRTVGHGLIGSRDMAARADHGKGRRCSDPGAGGGVKHRLGRRDASRPEQEWNEVRRDMCDGSVVRRCGPVPV